MTESFQQIYSNYIDAMNAKQKSMDAFAKFNFRWLRKIQIELQLDSISIPQDQKNDDVEEAQISKENVDESNIQIQKKKGTPKKKKLKQTKKITPSGSKSNLSKSAASQKLENTNNKEIESELNDEKQFLDTGSLLTNILPDGLDMKGRPTIELNSEYITQFTNSKEFNKRWKENLKPQVLDNKGTNSA